MEAEAARELFALQKQLLEPSFRRDSRAVAARLADGFREVSSSGRTYDKQVIVAALAAEPPGSPVVASGFEATLLALDAALVTYRTDRGGVVTHRSSVWVRHQGSWQMLFHQGTPAAQGASLQTDPETAPGEAGRE
ncbi:MAG TPA: nuclear transport factor 2 family protein [Acidobacteriaceae bacterium]